MPFGGKYVALTGGEPHLHLQFEQIVGKLVSHGLRTEPYLPLMEKYPEKISHVFLSLDGENSKTYDEIRGGKGAFEKVMNSVRVYLEKGYHLTAGMTLNQVNKGHGKISL